MPIEDDEIAAALAAIQCYVEQDRLAAPKSCEKPAWRVAAALEAQGLRPARHAARSTWGSADRVSRAHHWSYGIVGI